MKSVFLHSANDTNSSDPFLSTCDSYHRSWHMVPAWNAYAPWPSWHFRTPGFDPLTHRGQSFLPIVLLHSKECLEKLKCLSNYQYIQTWANNHLRIATTCLRRPPFWSPNFDSLQHKATFQQWPQIWGPEGGCCTQV